MKARDKIINAMNEQEVRGAVCQFMYHGWLVSFSQVFANPTVAIFKGDVEMFDLPSIGFAIEQIDKLNKL
ncbi:MAG: hypothetical protein GY928_16255 [Colwellia sp.]|nr:hypothetical protein [Colwellia sp.]